MTELEALNKLDTLLTFLQRQENALPFLEILDSIKEIDSEFDGRLLKIALYKLQQDKYAYILTHLDDKHNKIYSISIEGSIFHGYVKQKGIDDENAAIIVRNENRRLRNDHRLILGTWFAGIAALLLLLWQVFLYFYPVHSDYPYWIWQTIPKRH